MTTVGDAGGAETLSASDGTVTRLRRDITVRSDDGTSARLVVTVSREEAVQGQQHRGRPVNSHVFDAHWRRWVQQRPALTRAARGASPGDLRDEVHLVTRSTAVGRMHDILRHDLSETGTARGI